MAVFPVYKEILAFGACFVKVIISHIVLVGIYVKGLLECAASPMMSVTAMLALSRAQPGAMATPGDAAVREVRREAILAPRVESREVFFRVANIAECGPK
jgi:hypothetical protein